MKRATEQAEAPFAEHKLEALKAEAKFTDSTQVNPAPCTLRPAP